LNKTEETKEALCFFFFFAQEDSVNYSLNWETVLHCTEIFSFLFFHLTHAFSSLSHTHTHTHMPYTILSHEKVSRYWTHHYNEGDGSNETPDKVIVHPEPASAMKTCSQ